MALRLPCAVATLARALAERTPEVYLVGGAVRDLALGREPRDFDLASDLPPEAVADLARRHGWTAVTVGERFGTVAVLLPGATVEVTTFRTEGRYEDARRPADVRYVADVRADLARRDFTINAMALRYPDGLWVDPYRGRADLRRRLVRTVGEPGRRFAEDGLRLLRAVRLAAELGFRLEEQTALALAVHAERLHEIAAERVAPEIERLLLAPGSGAASGLALLFHSGLASVVLPELVPMIGLPPDGEYHRVPLLEHTLEVVALSPPRPAVRWAALFHDAGKPYVRELDPVGRAHFFGHDALGAEIVRLAARRLKLPAPLADRVARLVRRHMFAFDMGPRGMRRLLAELGPDGLEDLLDLKLADMVGTGGAHVASAYDAFLAFRARLRDELARTTALRVPDLAVDGHDVMRILGTPPGPAVGAALAALLERVLENPELNDRERLLSILRTEGKGLVGRGPASPHGAPPGGG